LDFVCKRYFRVVATLFPKGVSILSLRPLNRRLDVRVPPGELGPRVGSNNGTIKLIDDWRFELPIFFDFSVTLFYTPVVLIFSSTGCSPTITREKGL
jgi:hypothetical protein